MTSRLGPTTTVTVLWCLLIAALVLPGSLFALMAWQSRRAALEEAGQRTERTMLVLHGQAQNVFETYELMMDRIQDRVRGRPWDEMQTDQDLHGLLKTLAGQHRQIGTALLFDASGTAQASSIGFPATPVNVADRDYWRAFQSGHRTTFIGETVRGRTTGNLSFNVARPLFDHSGTFRGAIVLAAYPSYFAQVYAKLPPGLDHSAGLVRDDGVFLVRDAETRTSVDQPRASSNFMRARERSEEGQFVSSSTVDAIERIVAYKKLASHPVYVIYAVGTGAILAGWRADMFTYALLWVPATAGLAMMTLVALLRTRRELEAADRLKDEIERRAQAEQKLVEAQKMEALGHLTGGIAHDFNNLLTVIMGNLDLLRRAREERRARLLDNALNAVEQGRKLTGQLLSFGRRGVLRPENTDLNTLVIGASDMLHQSLRGDISLTFDLQPDLWPVEVDRSQFQIALINLAANARDAMPRGGEMRIRTENAVLDDGDRVVISVSDTGVGIPSEALSRVFEPFFTSKPLGKGTGLGLAQVYGFVQQSEGAVEIRSEEGRGTTVVITLPRSRREDVSAGMGEGGGPATAARMRASLLLVEDNEQVAAVATALLEESGHRVTLAMNAHEALALLQEDAARYDLVVSDLVMPGEIGGLDLARRTRQQWPQLGVLLVTGYSEVAAEAEREGFALLRKPYRPEELEEAIQALAAAAQARTLNDNVVRLRS